MWRDWFSYLQTLWVPWHVEGGWWPCNTWQDGWRSSVDVEEQSRPHRRGGYGACLFWSYMFLQSNWWCFCVWEDWPRPWYVNCNVTHSFSLWCSLLTIHVSSFSVCDDTCRDTIMDPTNELLVCTISGRCFDRLLSPAEMEPDIVSPNFILLLPFSTFNRCAALICVVSCKWQHLFGEICRNSNKGVWRMRQNHLWDLVASVILIPETRFLFRFISFIIWMKSKLLMYVLWHLTARAYLLGYNCADEKELKAALRFCWIGNERPMMNDFIHSIAYYCICFP